MAIGDRPRTGVRDYYDSNTWKFLLSGSERAIHRELWGPGVTTRGEAVHHAHALVLDQLGPGDRRVLDLGCGVGTAALYLARRRPVEVVGVSISPAQVRLADRYAARGARRGDVRFRVADFTALPADLTGFDLAFAIEAFVHADPAAAFFDGVARALRPGGALVIIDDVRAEVRAGDRDDPALDDPALEDSALEDFRAGWHAPSVLPVAEIEALAAGAGLAPVASDDLSGLQRLGRPRDRVIHAALPLLRRARGRSMWAQSMVGGDALQHCHRAGLLQYRLLRFERRTV